VRPEDRTPDNANPDEETPAGDEGAAPPPATWAGRHRSAGAGEAGAREPAAEAEEQEPAAEEGEDPAAEGEEEELEADDAQELEAEEEEAEEEELAAERDEAEEEELEAEEEAEDAYADEGESAEAELAVAATSAETVEADTLSLADREQAEEEAMAGLRARTAEHEAKLPPRSVPPPSAPEPAEEAEEAEEAAEAPAAVAVADEDDGKPPRAKRLWARFLAASLLIVASMAAATSISLLNELTDFAKGLSDNEALASLQDQLATVEGGDPQTLLIIGSDKRLDTQGDPGRSDTTILLRVDPEKDAIALLSIPRDLRVTIPTVGGSQKFNVAYSAGGPDLTLEVVKRLTGLDINHVVNINFTGFADAVNAIGCVYIDVDRRYYIPPESGTSEIDLEAGYQRMCGYNALQYVRFRHFDNDLVRSARQQDFLREARQKLTVGKLVGDAEELIGIFTDYTTSDIDDGVTLLELMKTFLKVQAAPVNEVHFPAELGDGTSGYVEASNEAIDKAVAEFMGVEGTPGARPGGESENVIREQPSDDEKPGDGGGGDGKGDDKPEQDFVGPEMQDSTAEAKTYSNQFSKKKKKSGDPLVDFPILYPTRLVPGSFIARDSRAFVIDGGDKEEHRGYKFVAQVPGTEFGNGLQYEYYGVSGTNWLDAPILDNPSETRTIDGREYDLFYDGDRLRLVGFTTNNGAYWVNNTLSQSLEEGQMLSIATSMREFD
jgi:LCP family protein required for cell wall assembly